MIEKLYYFDICALVVLLILILSLIIRKMYRSRVNRMFLLILVVFFLTVVTDLCAILSDAPGFRNDALKVTFHTLYLFFHVESSPLYLTYIITLTDTWHNVKKHRWIIALLLAPICVVAASLLQNLFTGNMFYINEHGIYCRGQYFYLFYVVTIVYFIFGVVYLANYRKLFSLQKFMALFLVFPVLGVVTLVQMLFPNLTIEMFANAVSLLYISLIVQRTDEMIDPETGLLTLSNYVHNLDNDVITGKHVKIIMLNIVNYGVAKKMLGYEYSHILMNMIANEMRKVSLGMRTELYHLEEGKFRIVFEEASFDKVVKTAEQINATMKQNIILNEMEINLNVCVCVVNFPEDVKDAESLIAFGNELDSRYYNGEVRFAANIYQQSRYDTMKDIDRIIEHALTHNQFEVYYQPIYSVEEQKFTAAEALCRLHTEDGGFISPDIFITAAERSGAIHKIGDFVLEEVCKFIASEEFKKLPIKYIEVNLSVTQCMQKGLASRVLQTLRKYDVDVSQINLEITETAVSYSQSTMMDNINSLYSAGINLSLDDFGTGYSNMMRIASLPLQIVKLDKTFSSLEESDDTDIVLKNTIHMIKELDMEIVVEGVETAALATKFADLNCEYIQGFYYSRPMPKDDFISFLIQQQQHR